MFDIFYYDDINKIDGLITKCKQESRTEYFWLAHRDVDYTNFNWRWFPKFHQRKYKHAWPSHNNLEHYTTYLVPLHETGDTVFHKNILSTINNKYYDVCCINTSTHELPYHDFKVNLITTMEAAIESAVRKSTKPWLWIICDICDYTNFNFDWLPNNHDVNYIHCWPSGNCEKGDTFLINVKSYLSGKKEYNFNHEPVKRKLWPVVKYSDDNLTQALSKRNNSIYSLMCKDHVPNLVDVCLWEKRPAVSLNESNSATLVPRDCVVEKEIYDYPYQLKFKNKNSDIECDIVFISYDELQADERYAELVERFPNSKRIHGIEGMENALREAAKISSTDYFYVVFAKTKLYEGWDFSFKPDYWRDPRNYIFYAINQSNNLVYGEMGIILYNKNFLLNIKSTDDIGLDLTMSFPIQVVPIVSAYGEFATDPYRAWRTAFRETCKLAYFNNTSYCVETEYRINIWRSKAHGKFANEVLLGANDGYDYFVKNKNNYDELKKTFSWDWLRKYYNSKYN